MFIGIEKKKWDTLINICVLIKSTSVHKKDGKSRCFFLTGVPLCANAIIIMLDTALKEA